MNQCTIENGEYVFRCDIAIAFGAGCECFSLVGQVENEIAHGRSGATLIRWYSPAESGAEQLRLFGEAPESGPDARASIGNSILEFEAAGWKWNESELIIEKAGWWAFYRSQGSNAPPILQWSFKENTEPKGGETKHERRKQDDAGDETRA